MKTIKDYIRKVPALALGAAAVLWLATACSNEEDLPSGNGGTDGLIQVDFEVGGTYGAPFSDLGTKAATQTSADQQSIPDMPDNTGPYQPGDIEDGTTLWIAVYEAETADTPPEEAKLMDIKPYRVSGYSLIPCQVDDEGNAKMNGSHYIYEKPLYLTEGTYYFRALGPARKLANNGVDGEIAMNIDNGQWVIAHDDRYVETAGNSKVTLEEDKPNALVRLNPLINQTAQLKFTIYTEDPFVHTMNLQTTGVEVSGLQDYYSKGADGGEPWNWTLYSTYLEAKPADKNTVMYLKEPTVNENTRMVIETPILPTDAVATPLIVLFNMEVNGNPTQYEMMLNRKMFRAGYSYHYRGKLTLIEGVTAIDWENISWEADIPFFENEP